MSFPKEVHRWALNLTLIGVLFGIGYHTHQQGSKAEDALCVLRADYQRRLEASEEYVRDVRSGARKPIPGITQADIQRGIDSYKANINALSSLDC